MGLKIEGFRNSGKYKFYKINIVVGQNIFRMTWEPDETATTRRGVLERQNVQRAGTSFTEVGLVRKNSGIKSYLKQGF